MIEDRNSERVEYWDIFGMERDAFSEDAIEGLYFPGAERKELFETAQDLANNGSQTAVFYGPPGIGKTKLFRELADNADIDGYLIDLNAGFMMTPEQLQVEVASALGLEQFNYDPEPFREQLLQRLQPQSLVLLLDDAHELQEQTLQYLLDLANDLAENMRLLLFAATDANGFLRPELDRSDLQQIAIEPLDVDAMEAYVRYRLNTAGYEREFPFTEAELASMFKASQGNPQRINEVAEEKMRAALNTGSHPKPEVESRIPWMHVAAGVTLAFALGLLWTVQDDGSGNYESIASAEGASGNSLASATPGSEPVGANAGPKGANPPAAAVDWNANQTGSSAASPEREGVSEKVIVTKNSVRSIKLVRELEAEPASEPAQAASNVARVQAPAEASSQNTLPPEVAERLRQVEPAAGGKQQPVAARPSQAATKTIAAKTGTAVELVEKSQAAKAPVLAQATAVETAALQPAARNNAAIAGLSSDEKYLMALDANRYSLQLLGSTSREGIASFVRKHGDLDIRVYEHQRNQQPWFVAVLGDYADRPAALKAVDKLTPALQKLKPWARPVNAIQTDIRTRFGVTGQAARG